MLGHGQLGEGCLPVWCGVWGRSICLPLSSRDGDLARKMVGGDGDLARCDVGAHEKTGGARGQERAGARERPWRARERPCVRDDCVGGGMRVRDLRTRSSSTHREVEAESTASMRTTTRSRN